MQNSTFFGLLRPIFAPKMKTAPPKGIWELNCCEGLAVVWTRIVEFFWFGAHPKSVKIFFLEIICFRAENPLNFRFRQQKPFEFRLRPFFCCWRSPVIDKKKTPQSRLKQTIRGRVDRASATEAVDSGSIPGQVKPKTRKIGIHSFPA